MLDIYGFRVIVKDVAACYLALGALHSLYKPVPGKFKDYIAIPKVNGYQSLHTTLIGPYGMPVEIQIRTQQMHRIAETGVASHWLYKSSDAEINEVQQRTHQWLQSLLDIQSTSGDAAEFLEHIKVDLFPDEVYVFTPKGKIMALPRGATAVDFAYAVHTDIGNRCMAAKINYELVPLRTELKNGDRVEIITAPHANPNPAWLNFVKTGKARSHIRHFLKTMQSEEAAALGERLLNQASKHEVLADLGLGRRLLGGRAGAFSGRPTERTTNPSPPAASRSAAPRAWRCSSRRAAARFRATPSSARSRKGQGLVVHASECSSIVRSRRNEPDQWIDVEWDLRTSRLFQAASA